MLNYLLKWNVSITFFISLQCNVILCSGTQLKEVGCKKIISYNSVQYLITRVTFYVFTCNRMVQLKMALKSSEIYSNKQRWLFRKLEHLIGKYFLARNFDDNSLLTEVIEMSVLIQECTFHISCRVITETFYLTTICLCTVAPPSPSPPPPHLPRQNWMLSCKKLIYRRSSEAVDPVFVRMHEVWWL